MFHNVLNHNVFITGGSVRDGNEERIFRERPSWGAQEERKIVMSIFSLIVRNQVCVCALYTLHHTAVVCCMFMSADGVMIDSQAAPVGPPRLWPLTLKSPARFNDPILSHPGICYHGNIAFFPPLIMQESSPSVSNSVSSQVGDLWGDVCSLISISTDALFVSPKLMLGFLQVKYYS